MTGDPDSGFRADRVRSSADDAALWRRFRGVPGEDARLTALQKMKLAGPGADTFALFAARIAPGDELRGEALMSDVWRIGQERLKLAPGAAPWDGEMPSRHFADRVHRFAWLPDLLMTGPAGAERARRLTDSWTEQFGRFHGFSWRPDATADRLWNWLLCGDVLLRDAEGDAAAGRRECLLRQVRFLADVLETCNDPAARWLGAAVLVLRAAGLRASSGLDDALQRLEAECTAQILPDGGHVSRSPSHLLSALLHLETLDDILIRAGKPVPDWMTRTIARMGAMVAFFRSGDGALSCFNDGDESRADVVAAAIATLPAPPRRFTFAPKSGFQRLEKGSVRLLMDCGEAPARPFGDAAHAGALGFELSDGPARLVTSCGYSAEVNVDWQAAVRRTGAHSTLVLAGRDSSRFVLNEQTRLRAAEGPDGIAAKRLEEADEIWLDAQHGGFKQACGLLHRRRLFMSGQGERVTGEDSLVRPIAQAPSDERKFVPYELRFHLHPTVTAMMSRDAIRLICNSGEVWKFKTSHEGARLERTVYLSRGIVEQPEQIVLSGYADPNGDGSQPPNCVRWAFVRESRA